MEQEERKNKQKDGGENTTWWDVRKWQHKINSIPQLISLRATHESPFFSSLLSHASSSSSSSSPSPLTPPPLPCIFDPIYLDPPSPKWEPTTPTNTTTNTTNTNTNIAIITKDNNTLTTSHLTFLSYFIAHSLLSTPIPSSTSPPSPLLSLGGNQPIGVCGRGIESILGCIGIMKSGNFFLPLDPSFPLSYLLSLVKRTEVGVVLTTREEWGEVVGGEGRKRKRGEELGWVGGWEGGRVVFLDELLENHFSVLFPSPSSSPSTSPPSPPPFPPVGEDISSLVNYEPSPDSAAYLATTSGSTGTPKGVIGTQKAIINRFFWTYTTLPFQIHDKRDIFLQKTSLSFLDSIFESFGSVGGGAALVLCPKKERNDLHSLSQMISTFKITRIVLIPSLLHLLLSHFPPSTFSSLTHITVSGEPLMGQTATLFQRTFSPSCLLLNCYGSTEVAADATCHIIKPSGSEGHDGAIVEKGFVPIGKPLTNMGVLIMGEDGKEVEGEGEGELIVVGVGVAGGYWKDEEETRKRFISLDPLLFPSLSSPCFSSLLSSTTSPSSQIIGFRTGDLGRKDRDNNYHFLGRTTSQIKVRGFRVNLSQVEDKLRGCEGVGGVAVCAFSLSDGDSSSSCPLLPGMSDADRVRIAAFVTKKEGEGEGEHKYTEEPEAETDREKLLLQRKVKKYAKKNLPGFMVPQLVVCMDAFPRGLTGKIDQKRLIALAREQALREREKGREAKGETGEKGEGGEESFFVVVFRFLLSQVTSNYSWFKNPSGSSSPSSLLPSDRPLAELGVDSMDAMALKHRFMAWVRQHKDEMTNKQEITYDHLPFEFALFDSLSVSHLAQQVEASLGPFFPPSLRSSILTSLSSPPSKPSQKTKKKQKKNSTPAPSVSPSASPSPSPVVSLPPSPVVLERHVDQPMMTLKLGGLAHCASGDLEKLRQIVEEEGWDPTVMVDKNKSNGVMWAAGGNHLNIVTYLFDDLKPRFPNLNINEGNKAGRTALMQAAKHGHVEMMKLLLRFGASPNIRMRDGSSLLDWAVFGGERGVVEFIVEEGRWVGKGEGEWEEEGEGKEEGKEGKGGEGEGEEGVFLLGTRNKFGCTAVHWAASSGNLDTCRWLFKKGFDFSVLNYAGHGVVSNAAWKGWRDVIEWFIEDSDKEKGKEGEGNKERGENEGPRLGWQLGVRDKEGKSAAIIAREGGHLELADWLEEKEREMVGRREKGGEREGEGWGE